MIKLKVFCFGFGQVAESFINKLINEKKDFDLSITSRQETHQIDFNNIKINSYQFSENKADQSLVQKLEYGDHKGNWVNENSVTKPSSSNGVNRLKAENTWLNLSKKNNYPLQIFRLAGIYSEKFNILKRLQTGTVKIVNKKDHFFSRIHVEDIANILFKSINNFKNNEIYNICDDKPASQNEIAIYGAKLLKIDQPKPIKLEEVESKMLQNFYKDSKKVDNTKMKNFFKYNLKFPTYIQGLDHIFNNNI